ncbi:MAG: hypothetical protein RLY83_150 [Actinomycetota bacterium]|jgi:hypothetical protein
MFRRITSLLAVLGIGAFLLVAAKFPSVTVGETAKPQVVTVQPKQPTLVCPGPVFVNGGQSGVSLGSFTQSGSAQIAGVESGNSLNQTAYANLALKGKATGSKTFNAIQTQFANGKQAFGLTSANCVQGANNAWLVAGDNSVGREALLILVNSADVDATVSLQLYGPSGAIQGTGLSGISAPAGKVTVLPLSSFAPKAETFAVKVSSRGAELGIWLQQKTVRGLTPAGLELVGVSAEPSKQVSIPGVFLRNTTALGRLAESDANFADVKPLLRVTAPGDKDVNFTAQLQGADGSSFGTVLQGSVPAGSTKDFALVDLADGNYSMQVEADGAVLASVRYSRLSGGKPDFAWAQSVNVSKLNSGFTTANTAKTKLSVMNPTSSKASFSLNGRAYQVAANSNLVVDLAAGQHYVIKSTSKLAASQVLDVNGGVTVSTVLDYQSVGGKIRVSVR